VQQQLAETIAVLLQVAHLIEHGCTRRRQHTAHHHVSDLTAGMAADDGDGAYSSHRPSIPACDQG
jgi:hypothetical protein